MPERSMWTRNLLSRSKHYRSGLSETSLALKTASTLFVRRFGRSVEGDDVIALNRDFLVQLWVADRKMRSSKTTRKRLVDSHPSFLRQFGKRHSRVLSGDAKHSVPESPALDQRSPSQLVKDFLKSKPACVDPKKHLLVRSNLLITRDIEWANLALGFEQENRYVILDMWCPQAPVGYIREKSNIIARQLLRSRRPFVAFVIDENGDELFKICRPFWWITSSIYTEIDGEEVGVVHRRWHLWRRIYDLYLGNKQFATVENPGLWNWTFTLKDIDGNVLAEIDRNWRGFGFEILTDAGQYAIRFGGDGVCQTGSDGIKELEVVRPLSIPERAIALALAVSLDNDYFSRHGGWGIPFVAVEE